MMESCSSFTPAASHPVSSHPIPSSFLPATHHPTRQAIECMVVEALSEANHVYRFDRVVGDLDRFCEVRGGGGGKRRGDWGERKANEGGGERGGERYEWVGEDK